MEYLETVLRYVARGIDKVTQEGLHRAVEADLSEEGSAAMSTLAEQWTQEGLQAIREGIKRVKTIESLRGIYTPWLKDQSLN